MSVLKIFKVVFWQAGNKRVEQIKAYSKYDAKRRFYLRHPCDEIIKIEEVDAG